jgi:hypothetical protein
MYEQAAGALIQIKNASQCALGLAERWSLTYRCPPGFSLLARATLQVSRLNEGQTGVRRTSVWHYESEGLDEFRRLADRAGVRPGGENVRYFKVSK